MRQFTSSSIPVFETLENRMLMSASFLNSLSIDPTQTVSTVPKNGDVNPYGVAFVPNDFSFGGPINPGDILVSNFNAGPSNFQGTGNTIVDIHPDGKQTLFFKGKNLGLTTALAVLKNGYVIVGNMPTTDGSAATLGQTSLLVLNRFGNVVQTLSSNTKLDGPWDMTVNDEGGYAQLFVSDVLSGTVERIDLSVPRNGNHLNVLSETQIASGYAHRADAGAFEVGPTGLLFDKCTDTLYVASTDDNAIYAISDAGGTTHDHGKGKLIYHDNKHLRGPLGLIMAPNGNLIAAQSDAINPDPKGIQVSELVEFTTSGKFVAERSVDTSGTGGAFGVAISTADHQIRFAAVDDVNNTLEVWDM